jgi:cytochrome P450 family 6
MTVSISLLCFISGPRYARLQLKAAISFLLKSFTLKEQEYKPKKFDKSPFSVKDSKAPFELIQRTAE